MSQDNLKFALPMLVVALMTGCASTNQSPTFADQLYSEGTRTTALAELWESGQKLFREGESKIRTGESRITEGEKLLERGRILLSDGERRLVVEKDAYNAASSTFGMATTPAQLESELKSLSAIAAGWSRAEKDIARGQKLLVNGQEKLDQGRADVRQGEQMLARGGDMMQEAEAAYNSERQRRPEAQRGDS